MFMASAVLPMLGRAAMTIISDGMQAARHAIELDEAGGEPGRLPLLLVELFDRLDRVHDLVLHRQRSGP